MHMKKVMTVFFLCLSVMLSGCQSKEAKNMDALIQAIGQIDSSSGPVVAYVREQYELLSEEDKGSLKRYGMLLSAEAAYVDALIDAIGTVTPESSADIQAAENAYATIHEDAKPHVHGLERLQKIKVEYECIAQESRLIGFWVNEVLGSTDVQVGRGLVRSYGLDETNCHPVNLEKTQFELLSGGKLVFGKVIEGIWYLSENKDAVILEADGRSCTLEIQDEGGFLKLVGPLFDNQPFGYVKETDYTSAFADKYTVVELKQDNVHNYFADPVFLGKVETDQGKMHSAYWYASQAYQDGLVYLGSSCVIPVAYDHGGKLYSLWLEFPMLSTTDLKIKDIRINTDTRISGEVFYIKADYVSRNYINGDGYRVLELTNGVSLIFDGYDDLIDTFWLRSEATYEEHIY